MRDGGSGRREGGMEMGDKERRVWVSREKMHDNDDDQRVAG